MNDAVESKSELAEKNKRSISDTRREFYNHWTQINLRYGDTDRQGHINNAVYCTLLESGRVSFLFDGQKPVAGPDRSYVIAKLSLDYLNEMHFPGIAEIGSRIIKIGRTSFTVAQAIFFEEKCCSTAESIIVQLDEKTSTPSPITEALRARLESIS